MWDVPLEFCELDYHSVKIEWFNQLRQSESYKPSNTWSPSWNIYCLTLDWPFSMKQPLEVELYFFCFNQPNLTSAVSLGIPRAVLKCDQGNASCGLDTTWRNRESILNVWGAHSLGLKLTCWPGKSVYLPAALCSIPMDHSAAAVASTHVPEYNEYTHTTISTTPLQGCKSIICFVFGLSVHFALFLIVWNLNSLLYIHVFAATVNA